MPKLCKAGQQLREQIDDTFPDRDRRSDGWAASPQHKAHSPKSDHNPDASGMVRAIDIDADLNADKSAIYDLADQLRLLARTDKRLAYIIYNGKIASWRMNYNWRLYKGINPHKKHIHISFTKLGDNDGGMFYIPILTGSENGKERQRDNYNNGDGNTGSPSQHPAHCPTCKRDFVSRR